MTVTKNQLRDVFIKVMSEKEKDFSADEIGKNFEDTLLYALEKEYFYMKSNSCCLTPEGQAYIVDEIIM